MHQPIQHQPIQHLDLCSGVGGGFPLAALQFFPGKFSLASLAEVEPYCCDILGKRFPDAKNLGDVRQITAATLARCCPIDLITASPPCQPFSLQGKRRADRDPRDLFPAVQRIIGEARPTYFAIENVPGLLSARLGPEGEPGSYLRALLRQFGESGYLVEWLVASSGAFGAPWLRERLLLVGVAKCLVEKRQLPPPWAEQARGRIAESRGTEAGGSSGSEVAGSRIRPAAGVVRPRGVPAGCPATRAQRAAAGNLLDPRVAALALDRILYWHWYARHD